MATEKIVFEVETKTGNSAASVKSVKAELRALQNEMAGLQVGSDAFVKAAQKAGQLKDQIEDANMAVKAFNPEAKFQAFAGVLGGVANGFSAVQGAMALFGTENKDVEKAILQTQGAIAIATGINGLMGMKDAFIILGNVIKTQVVAAFATMRAAIISTGILGLVVLIGTLIYSWMEEKKANEEATKELERYGEAQRKLLDQEQKIQIARAKGRNKDILEASNQAQQNIRAYQKELEEKKINQDEFNRLVKGEQELLKISLADIDKKYAEQEEQRRKEAAEKEKKRLEDIRKKEEERFNNYIDRLKKELEANTAVSNAKVENSKKEYDATKDKYNKEIEEIEKLQKTALDYAANEKNSFADRRATLEEYLKAGIISQQQYADASVKITQQEQASKLAIYDAVGNALGSLGQLVGEQTAAGKSLAVAQATIDTYVGATKAYAQGGVLGFISAAAVVAAGLANVRKIVSTKIPGQSSGGASVSMSAPQAPQFNPALATQVQGGGDITLGAKPIPQKVYVVESDIRTVQNKVNVIENNSIIG